MNVLRNFWQSSPKIESPFYDVLANASVLWRRPIRPMHTNHDHSMQSNKNPSKRSTCLGNRVLVQAWGKHYRITTRLNAQAFSLFTSGSHCNSRRRKCPPSKGISLFVGYAIENRLHMISRRKIKLLWAASRVPGLRGECTGANSKLAWIYFVKIWLLSSEVYQDRSNGHLHNFETILEAEELLLKD